MLSQSCDKHFGRLSNCISCGDAPSMRPPRYLGFQSQQRKGECFMHGPHCASGTRNTLLRGRRDDETAVFSPLVSNFASTPSLDHVSGDPLPSVAHALTQALMKERSSCCVTEKLEWLTHIEAVLEILNEAIVITNQDER